MDKPYYQLSNPEFVPWLKNFIEVVTANQANLPITPAQITSLQNILTAHETKLNAQTAAEEAAQSATRDLNDSRKLSNSEVSFFNTIFKADKTIPRELLVEMGLQVSDGATSPPPAEPTDLTVKPNASGFNELKWKRNGNKPNTIFIIEAQADGAGDWVQVGAVTETTFVHENQIPGKQIAYRVKATRDKRESAWTTTVVAYYQ